MHLRISAFIEVNRVLDELFLLRSFIIPMFTGIAMILLYVEFLSNEFNK